MLYKYIIILHFAFNVHQTKVYVLVLIISYSYNWKMQPS